MPIDLVSGNSGTSVVAVGDISSFTLGDLRFGVKGTILDHQRKGFGLGLDLGVTVPTAKNDSFVAEMPEIDEAARETNRRVEFLILERQ